MGRLERSLAEFADLYGGELRKELEKRKLETEGKKSELMERLAEAVEKEHKKLTKKNFAKTMEKFEGMKEKDLKKELESRQLETTGEEDELMKRLTKAAEKEA